MKHGIHVSGLVIQTPTGRPLFDGLSLALARERVALVGRNGVGKSTLLSVLAGKAEPHAGRIVTSRPPHLVPQSSPAYAAHRSHGEGRRRALAEARASGAHVLLLDEPTEDLDEAAVAWLRGWLRTFPGCVLAASHDRRLLEDFEHFFIASESGCRYFHGSLAALDDELAREHDADEQRYGRNLQRLAAQEASTVHVARRKARKKRAGRCSELDRATSRIRLNRKRSEAQESHGRIQKVRAARLHALRTWSLSTRRALRVDLALDVPVPRLAAFATPAVVLDRVGGRIAGRVLFEDLTLRLDRERIGVTGPNGAGKTTLLETVLGHRAPSAGTATRDPTRIGAIAQGGADWMLDESLSDRLLVEGSARSRDEVAAILVRHRFPLALADRALRTLSPGERARAALLCLFHRTPTPTLLVLDEPTYSLDLVAWRALRDTLRAWPGGLLVASHDRTFLASIGLGRYLELGR